MIKLKFSIVVGGILVLCNACTVYLGNQKRSMGVIDNPEKIIPVEPDRSLRNLETYQNWKTYKVQKGDTLYRIARKFKKTTSEIMQLNGLQRADTIYPGQVLHIELLTQYPGSGFSTEITSSQRPTKQLYPGQRRIIIPPASAGNLNMQCYPPVQWQWPTYGNYEKTFSQTGGEGIIIWGQKIGQVVTAAASGRVTYSGSSYDGYPNAIVIQHNDAFSSLYAFNRKRQVQESAYVTGGQTIAEMGTDVSGRAVLHFEIRCHGKALDPLSYLPR